MVKFKDWYRQELLRRPGLRRAHYEGQWDIGMEASNLVEGLRISKGLTQTELAERIGTKQPSIARVENMRVIPSLDFLNKMARKFRKVLVLKLEDAKTLKQIKEEAMVDISSHSSSQTLTFQLP